MQLQVTAPERGAHTINATVRDADGTLVCHSAPVTSTCSARRCCRRTRPPAGTEAAARPSRNDAAAAAAHGGGTRWPLSSSQPSPLSHFDPADLLDVLSTGVVVLDAHLCVVYANVGAQDLLAVGLNKARGRPITELFAESAGARWHPAPLAGAQRNLRRT